MAVCNGMIKFPYDLLVRSDLKYSGFLSIALPVTTNNGIPVWQTLPATGIGEVFRPQIFIGYNPDGLAVFIKFYRFVT